MAGGAHFAPLRRGAGRGAARNTSSSSTNNNNPPRGIATGARGTERGSRAVSGGMQCETSGREVARRISGAALGMRVARLVSRRVGFRPGGADPKRGTAVSEMRKGDAWIPRGSTIVNSSSLSLGAAVSPGVWSNPVFKAGFAAWLLAQILKVFTSYLKTKRWDWRPLFDSGGMPSSHSALCMGLTASVACLHGLGSSLFPICLGFSSIVMYDAAGVRRQAGRHAEVLNAVVDELKLDTKQEKKLKEVLGHSKTQVFFGAVLGLAIGLLVK